MIKWIIEPSTIDRAYIDLAQEIKRQGMEVEIIPYHLSAMKDTNFKNYKEDDCVIFQGGMFFALYLLKHFKFIPCAWFTLENYKCSTYYAHLGKYLLNEDYVIMPVGDVIRSFDNLREYLFGRDDCLADSLFFRPDTGVKLFNARVHNMQDLKAFKESWSFVTLMTKPSDLVVISSPKSIIDEYRFICADGEIITGCKYKSNGETCIEKGYPEEALKLAKEIASNEFKPDIMYTIDICSVPDYINGWVMNNTRIEYKLVEINSFSCAGLYACDIPKIVTTASKLAEKEWKDYWNK